MKVIKNRIIYGGSGMARNVVIFSQTEEASQILKSKLEPLKDEFSDLTIKMAEFTNTLSSFDSDTAAIVLNHDAWSENAGAQMMDLKVFGYKGPFVVLIKDGVQEAALFTKSLEKVMILEKPVNYQELFGIARRMVLAPLVAQRVHKRFPSDENGELEPFGKTVRHACRVRNISKGGAYLELVAPDVVMHKGDMLRVKIELKGVSKAYTMQARVAWIQTHTQGGGLGLGVEFMGPAEMGETTKKR